MSYQIYEQIIKDKGITSAQVSRGTGLSQTVFSEWKKGKATPKMDKMKKIADYLGVSIEFLTTGENSDGYYYDKETAELAQELYQNKDLHMLFDEVRDASASEIKTFYDMVMVMKRRERHED